MVDIRIGENCTLHTHDGTPAIDVHYENQPTPLLRNTGGGAGGQGAETGEGKITPTQHLSHPFFLFSLRSFLFARIILLYSR